MQCTFSRPQYGEKWEKEIQKCTAVMRAAIYKRIRICWKEKPTICIAVKTYLLNNVSILEKYQLEL